MEAFVYIWENKNTKRKYIGYHKGKIEDGYISSSANDNFWSDYEKGELVRHILFQGTKEECLKYEQDYLKAIDISSDEWYNNARGAEIIFTQEVRDKIRNHHLGGTSGMKGKKHSEETKQSIKNTLSGRVFSEEHLQKLRKPNKNKGIKSTEKYKKSIRDRFIDNKIYTFFNIDTKKSFTGTRSQFQETYNIARHNIVGLVLKKTKILGKQWILQETEN